MPTIFAHHDADGITTAYFTQIGIGEECPIEFPEIFGDTSKFAKGDYMCDMRPDNPEVVGTVIDHHLPHPEKRNYKLISADYPASLIAWETYKDKIPKEEWWKVVIGLGGDVQLELIPIEVIKECPSLLRRVITSAYSSYGSWKFNDMPLYKLLSSPINAFLRKGDFESAYNYMKYSDSPYTLFNAEDANNAKKEIYREHQSLMQNSRYVDYGNLYIVVFNSKYRMTGYQATVVGSVFKDSKTVLALNERDGSLSLRGDLATYYREIFNQLKYVDIDGHPKYMGGRVHKKNVNKFLEDVDDLLKCVSLK